MASILFGLALGVGFFIGSMLIGLYDHCRERRAYRRGQRMLHPLTHKEHNPQ
jgi:hypothetical protein